MPKNYPCAFATLNLAASRTSLVIECLFRKEEVELAWLKQVFARLKAGLFQQFASLLKGENIYGFT